MRSSRLLSSQLLGFFPAICADENRSFAGVFSREESKRQRVVDVVFRSIPLKTKNPLNAVTLVFFLQYRKKYSLNMRENCGSNFPQEWRKWPNIRIHAVEIDKIRRNMHSFSKGTKILRRNSNDSFVSKF